MYSENIERHAFYYGEVYLVTSHQVAQEKKLVLPSVGRHFLLNWTFVLKVILKDLTLISADMFGQYSLWTV